MSTLLLLADTHSWLTRDTSFKSVFMIHPLRTGGFIPPPNFAEPEIPRVWWRFLKRASQLVRNACIARVVSVTTVKYTDYNMPHRYGNSHDILDLTVLPANRQR